MHRGHEFTQMGEDFNEAPLRSCMAPRVQRSPSALMHRGYEFNETLVRSCTGAVSSRRPQCAHT